MKSYRNSILCMVVFFQYSLAQDNELIKSLQGLQAQLEKLDNLVNIQELEIKMEKVYEDYQSNKDPKEIKKFLDLLRNYSTLNPPQKELKKHGNRFALVFLAYFYENNIELTRSELIKKMSKDFNGDPLTVEEIFDMVAFAADRITPRNQSLKDVIRKWLDRQEQANDAIQVMDAILKGFDLREEPIRYTGYVNPNKPSEIQQAAFSGNLYDNYLKALAKAIIVYGFQDALIKRYEKYTKDLQGARGKMPEQN